MILRPRLRGAAVVALGVALVAGWFDPITGTDHYVARAEEDMSPLRVARAAPGLEPAAPPARPFPPRGSIVRRGAEHPEGASGWWLGTAGIALALAVCGGISAATRRGWRWPQATAGTTLRVVGRTSLSPRHTVHLLSIGERVLIVGTGPQGAPSLLGELTDPEDLERLAPVRAEDRGDDGSGPAAPPRSVVVNWRRPGGDDR